MTELGTSEAEPLLVLVAPSCLYRHLWRSCEAITVPACRLDELIQNVVSSDGIMCVHYARPK
jgi:hypothetical protein